MFKKRSPPQGRPSLGINVIGRAVTGGYDLVLGGVRDTQQVMKTATKTLLTDPLARVAKPVQDIASNVVPFDIRHQVRPKYGSSDLTKLASSERWSAKQENVMEYLLAELKKNFLFTELGESQLDKLVQAFEKFSAPAGTYIINEGEEGDYFYILYEGKVTYEIGGQAVGYAQANDGSDTPKSFGELALFFAGPRAASVAAEEDCILYRLDQVNFRLVVQHQGVQEDEQRMAHVKKVPVLQDLDEASIAKLVSSMTSLRFEKGQILFEKGDKMTDFFIVQTGQVLATQVEWGGAIYEDERVGPNEAQNFFGWKAMIKGEPLIANIEAVSDCTVLAIQGDTFRRVVGNQDEVLARLQNARQLQNIAIFRDSCLTKEQVQTMVAIMLPPQTYRRQTKLVKEGTKVDAAITFIRRGQVKVESKMDNYTKILQEGAYYGQDWMLADQNKDVDEDVAPLVESRFTVTAEPNTEVQVLMLEDVRQVINTSLLGLGKPSEVSALDNSIRIEDVQRHKMLGAGSFGQVWLASYAAPGSPGKKQQVFALKVQSKFQLIQSGQAEGVIAEVNIMKSLKSPFIIRLYATFQDNQRVFMLTSLLQGGELEAVMGSHAMDDSVAAFYAAGILEGLIHMHQRHIIHRDLKPENVLINSNGYPVLIDLGFAKYVAEKTYTFCGTPMYIAPEVIQYKGHDKGADYWSWACMVFEMVTSKYPFYESNMAELDLFKRICNGQFKIYGFMSYEARLLFINLLVPDPAKRLGARPNGWVDLQKLSFFDGIDFKGLGKQALPAPWVPDLKNPLDSSKFAGVNPNTPDKMHMTDPAIDDELQAMFHAFGKHATVTE